MKPYLTSGIALLLVLVLLPAAWLWWDQGGATDADAALSAGDSDSLLVFMSPTCGCCGDWVEHMRENGFEAETRETNAINAVKEEAGLPRDLVSCHTAFIGGYLIEGHVPAKDVQRLLEERPDAAGLSVPRMPIGSPGMEIQGEGRDEFDVVLFREDGSREVFNHYPAMSSL